MTPETACGLMPGMDLVVTVRRGRARRFRLEKPKPLPLCPTCARPGTEAKIGVMEGRAARGEQIFHPRDRNLNEEQEADLDALDCCERSLDGL